MLASAALAVFAACGGDGRDALDREEFVRRAHAACAEFNAQVLALELPATRPETDRFLERKAELDDRLTERLDALEPPEELRDDFEEGLRRRRESELPEPARREAEDALARAELSRCTAFGVTGLPGGTHFAARIDAFCRDALARVKRVIARAEVGDPASMRRVAAVLTDIADHREPGVPAAARAMYFAARAELRRTADALEAGARGIERRDRRAIARAGRADARHVQRGYTAFETLNLDHCQEIYPTLAGR